MSRGSKDGSPSGPGSGIRSGAGDVESVGVHEELERGGSSKLPYSSGKTGKYSDDADGNRTEAYRDPASGSVTGVYDDRNSAQEGPSGAAGRTKAHGIAPGDTVDLPDGSFVVERIISGDGMTGEAVVYQVRDASGSSLVLKMYLPFARVREEPNPEALMRIQKIRDEDILRLHAFGTGERKFKGAFCWEVSDLARGGTLLDVPSNEWRRIYSLDFVSRSVVPQIFSGIRCLHRNLIYHCDLKPQNVFYLDERRADLVIGDYGSAKTSEGEERREAVYTSMVKGSNFFRAPEQADGLVSEKNDYYSFGMILLNLLYPEVFCREGMAHVRQRAIHHRPILDFKGEFGRLNALIGGLTLVDVDNRWGQKEVERWLGGDTVSVAYSSNVALQPLHLGRGVVLSTIPDLLEYIEIEKNWPKYLVADQPVFMVILNWLVVLHDAEVSRSFNRMVTY